MAGSTDLVDEPLDHDRFTVCGHSHSYLCAHHLLLNGQQKAEGVPMQPVSMYEETGEEGSSGNC